MLNANNSGHYFIIATADKSKAVEYNGQQIHFDSNKVIYLYEELYKKEAIKLVNKQGIKTRVGNQYGQHFYNPDNEEYKSHPEWSRHYHNVLISIAIRETKT